MGADEQSLIGILQKKNVEFAKVIPPLILVELYACAAGNSDSAGQANLETALTELLSHPEIVLETRFSLAEALLLAPTKVLEPGALEAISLEAVQITLSSPTPNSISLALTCASSGELDAAILLIVDRLSPETVDVLISLICTSIPDGVNQLLSAGTTTSSSLELACTILARYAQGHMKSLVESEVYLPALVAAHHLAVLAPRIPGAVPCSDGGVWAHCQVLRGAQALRLQSSILRSLANLLQSTADSVA